MKKNIKTFKYLFLVVACLHLVSICLNFHLGVLITKVLIIPLLFLYNWSSIRKNAQGSVQLFIALFFSWVGDIFLLKSENEMYFIFGLAAFLCAHIAYIFLFRELRFIYADTKISPLYIMPFFMYTVGLLILIYPNLGDLSVPVIVYALVITLMGIAALLRLKNTSSKSFWFIFGGAILFMVSDSTIAMNKFYETVPFADLFIMLTYIASQYCISKGSQLHMRQIKSYI